MGYYRRIPQTSMTPAEDEDGHDVSIVTGEGASPLNDDRPDLGFEGGTSGASDSEDTPLAKADALAAVEALSIQKTG